MTLYDAMARALKYNLDLQIELMEESLAAREFDVARAEMLPSLVANAAWRGRNNYAGGTSISVPSGTPTGGNPTASSFRNQLTADLALSWDILDFGVSYIQAQQTGDARLIADERKRKVANRLMEDVRTAYWRAVSAEHLVSGLRSLARKTEVALQQARELETSGQASPLAALTFQRELIDIKSEIENLEDSISVAKTQLAALMNLPPQTRFKLNHSRQKASSLKINKSADELIELALANRSELREVAYELRSNRRELDKAFLEVLPSARAFIGANLDANTLLFNNAWVPFGATVSANLMNVFKLPARKNRIKAQEALLDRRALALAVAIVTQVHVSRARFGHAKKRFTTSQQRVGVQVKIRKQVRSAVEAGTASDQSLIREEMNTLVARAKRDIAYSDMQNTFANIYASVGVDPFKAGIDRSRSLDEISDDLQAFWRMRGDFGALKAKPIRKQPNATKRQSAQTINAPVSRLKTSPAGLQMQPFIVRAPKSEPQRISRSQTVGGPQIANVPVPRQRPATLPQAVPVARTVPAARKVQAAGRTSTAQTSAQQTMTAPVHMSPNLIAVGYGTAPGLGAN
ncbi:MAG: TolC family protein [Pseudomonadota bacterium]